MKTGLSRSLDDLRYMVWLEDRGVVVEHGLANDFDGSEALSHEGVVKVLEVEVGTLLLFEIGAELHSLRATRGRQNRPAQPHPT